ncbi:MAG: TrbC/VirB2 family protein [Pseudomonadota bacterium]
MSQNSLFNPSSPPPLSASIDAVSGSTLAEVVTPLCVLTVAFLGFAMLSGRFQVREGFRVVLGCFVLLGAPVLAAGLFSIASSNQGVAVAQAASQATPPSPRQELEPADNDPYAGASLSLD